MGPRTGPIDMIYLNYIARCYNKFPNTLGANRPANFLDPGGYFFDPWGSFLGPKGGPGVHFGSPGRHFEGPWGSFGGP